MMNRVLHSGEDSLSINVNDASACPYVGSGLTS